MKYFEETYIFHTAVGVKPAMHFALFYSLYFKQGNRVVNVRYTCMFSLTNWKVTVDKEESLRRISNVSVFFELDIFSTMFHSWHTHPSSLEVFITTPANEHPTSTSFPNPFCSRIYTKFD